VLIWTSKPGNFTLHTRSYEGEDELHDGKKMNDWTFNEKPLCYKYIVKTKDKDVKVFFNFHEGIGYLMINPGVKPDKTYAFSTEKLEHGEELIISSQNRKELGSSIGIYYFCVKGR
jgi:hypothetical protein